ncbi:MAG: tetratricopeptide repeat-containing serine/threonine-protein kinase [Thermoanaerobaculia bacterium]|nr:tetratricopeptide repeat-containing serine/threonine-protein kinase [Thermoanaerobaculia bacterium]
MAGGSSVFLAVQEMPVRRPVAHKISEHDRDTKEVIARFEQERQALAIMEHPNFAKVPPKSLWTMNLLGMVLREAEKLYSELLENWRRELGPEHPNTPMPMNSLAVVYVGQGEYGEAEALHAEALK